MSAWRMASDAAVATLPKAHRLHSSGRGVMGFCQATRPGVHRDTKEVGLDKKTTVAEMKRWVQDFCEARDWDQYHSPKELAIGIVTEAGELLDLFRFRSETEVAELLSDPEGRRQVQDELSDVLFFVLRMAQRVGFDLSESLAQ